MVPKNKPHEDCPPMPIYEYECRDCRQQFEYLVRGEDTPICPGCGSKSLDKQMSAPAAPQMAAGQGAACSLPRGDRPCAPGGGGCGGCPCAMGH